MIKNVILDLGGVIADIDYCLTANAFKKLGAENIDEVYSQKQQRSFIDDFDVGKITSQQFREKLKKLLGIKHISSSEFDSAWNSMILRLPKENLDNLIELRKNYNPNPDLENNF